MRRGLLFGAAALAVAALGVASPSHANTTWVLNDFELASEYAPQFGWHGVGGQVVTQEAGPGTTSGASNMKLAAAASGFQWGANIEYNVFPGGNPPDAMHSNAMAAFNWAGDGRESQSWFEFDVTFLASENVTTDQGWAGVQMSINSNNGWTQSPDNIVTRQWGTNGFDIPVETYHVVTTPIGTWSGLGTNKLPNGVAEWVQVNFAFNPVSAPAAVHFDNFVLVTPTVPEPVSAGALALGAAAVMRRRRASA